jgi:hypothetical protein
MKNIKLGKMEPDYGNAVCSQPETKKKVMRHPSVYVSQEDLPELSVGQEVILKGVVTAYSEGTRKRREGKGEKVEEDCSAEFEIHSMEVGDSMPKTKAESKKSDEDAIEEGLKETESKPKEDEEY